MAVVRPLMLTTTLVTMLTLIDEEYCDDVPSKDDPSRTFPAEVLAKEAAALPEEAADEKEDNVGSEVDEEDEEGEEGEPELEADTGCALVPTFQSFREN